MACKLDPESILLNWPLYYKESWKDYSQESLIYLVRHNFQIDAFCVTCSMTMPFRTIRGSTNNLPFSAGDFKVEIVCGRCSDKYLFHIRADEEFFFKIGQFPSLADISNEELAAYRNMLDQTDSSEFYKAIGLSAHGIGIGSYVYLRRIFERLIYNRFNQHKKAEAWVEEEFKKLRMDEKIQFLKSYIPEILYENRKIYSVLSKGIHEMSEEECLKFFDVIKKAIILILDEDKKLQEEQKAKADLTAAIAKL